MEKIKVRVTENSGHALEGQILEIGDNIRIFYREDKKAYFELIEGIYNIPCELCEILPQDYEKPLKDQLLDLLPTWEESKKEIDKSTHLGKLETHYNELVFIKCLAFIREHIKNK